MELCGVFPPEGTDGKSFASLLTSSPPRKWDNAAYSYYRNGISVRTNRYRLTRYFREQQTVIEVYDHRRDPYENRNLAKDKPHKVNKLLPQWQKGNTVHYVHKGEKKK